MGPEPGELVGDDIVDGDTDADDAELMVDDAVGVVLVLVVSALLWMSRSKT